MAAKEPARATATRMPRPAGMADIRALLSSLPAGDTEAEAAAARREATLTKPAGALGRLEELSRWLSAWQGRHPPRLERAMVCVFAANHGVARQGVSAYPAEVTRQMVANFRAGGAAINQLCRAMGAGLRIFEMDLDRPTEDFTAGPAMTERDFTEAFAVGLGAVDAGTDVLGLGEMGIANTTAAAALCHALFGGEAAQWTGPGTGVEGPGLARKAEVVARAVERNGVRGGDPLEALRAVGGREMVAIAGAVVGARLSHVPVLLDGYVCTSAAAALARAAPGALGHCRVAHVSAEPGHRMLLAHLGTSPLLDLGMRLGEGTGAALALSLLKGAVACHEGMATFAEAGVSGRSESD